MHRFGLGLCGLVLLGCTADPSGEGATGEASSTGLTSPTSSSGVGTSTGSMSSASESGLGSETSAAPSTSSGSPTTGSSSDTGVEGSSSTTTGAGFEPTLSFERITSTNRAYPEMHGGWGPHLRAPMRAADGSLWFAYDGGPSVLSNTTIHYARRDVDGTWSDAVSQAHTTGVQQNAAHVMSGNVILTYAVNTGASLLEECYLDVTNLDNRACNTVTVGGPYSTPPNSNYVGAALDPNGARIVWFTVVGESGGVGDFIYTYNFGGGWNGPVVTTLPGYNDMAYVRASFSAPNTISWLGQSYIGQHPNGEFGIGAREVSLGQPANFVTLGPTVGADETVRSAGDVWVDPDSGDTHAFARVDQATHYYVRPAGESWAEHAEPVDVLASVSRARFATANDGPLMVLSSGGEGLVLRWAEASVDIDWNAAPSVEVIVPTEGFAAPSALYTAGPEYQTAGVDSLHFAVCGQYQVADHEVWYVHVATD